MLRYVCESLLLWKENKYHMHVGTWARGHVNVSVHV